MISQGFSKKLKVHVNNKSRILEVQSAALSHRGEVLDFRPEQRNLRLVRSRLLQATAMIGCFASGKYGVIKPGF
jgi:hypothetical protein